MLFLLLLLVLSGHFQLCAVHPLVKKLPAKLIKSNGRPVKTAVALEGKMVALYFSASSCGPCREFTPQLIEFYKDVRKKVKLEIIFVSSDNSEKKMMDYMKKDKMPWLAIPFESSARKKLEEVFQVRGIPKLIVLDRNGKLLSSNARWDVVMLGEKAVKAWRSPRYKPLTYDDWKNSENEDPDKRKKTKKIKNAELFLLLGNVPNFVKLAFMSSWLR